jgi:signal transduction histidine kinase/ActR/RegA family two-component response regulator
VTGYRNRVLILLLSAMLPGALLATGWVLDASHADRVHTEQAIRATAEHVRDRLDAEMQKRIAVLTALATSPAAEGGDWAALSRHVSLLKQRQPLWRNVVVSTPDARQVFNFLLPDRLVTAAAPDTVLSVAASGRPAVSPIAQGRATGYHSAGIAVPIARDGEVPYVLSGVLDTAAVAQMFRDVLPPNWDGLIADSEGKIVMRARDGAALTGRPAWPSALDAVRDGREGEVRYGFNDDGPMRVLYLRSPVTGWTVHVGIRLSELPMLQTRSTDAAIAGGIASMSLAVLLSALLLRELRNSRRAAAALADSQRLEAIGQITGGVAHDFNNLLVAIQTAAQTIKDRPRDTANVTLFADSVLAATDRGAMITRQLLSYARKERHQPAAFRLGDRAAEIQRLLQQATRGDIRIELALDDDLWAIHGDAKALDVALINLAANARDAMARSGTLRVRAFNVRLGPDATRIEGLRGDFVAIAVSDTGTGIAAKDLDKVFQPFFTTKPAGQGTGLGLSQVQGFATQSGGTVSVASVVGQGTTITLYLPRSADAAPDLPRSAEAAPEVPRPAEAAPAVAPPAAARFAVSAAPASHAGARVLVVEDTVEVARAIEIMLDSAQFRHSTVHSAAEAIALVAAGEAFDFVLSDVVLGSGMSGLELEALLRTQRPELPVVLTTGYSEAIAEGTAADVQVLAKPFGPRALVAALDEAAARAGTRLGTPPSNSR